MNTSELHRKIQASLEWLRALEQDQQAISEEFASTARIAAHFRCDGCDLRQFFRHLEPPAHWLQTRPVVVCLFRALQLSDSLVTIFEAWAARRLLCTRTDVSAETVYEFLMALWKGAMAENLSDEKSLMISPALLESFGATFGVTHVAPSHVWSGISKVCSGRNDVSSFAEPLPEWQSRRYNPELGMCIVPQLIQHPYYPPMLSHTYAAGFLHQLVVTGRSPSERHTLLFVQHGSEISQVCDNLSVQGKMSRVLTGVYINKTLMGVPRCYLGARRGDWWVVPPTEVSPPPLNSSSLLSILRPLSQHYNGRFAMPVGTSLPMIGCTKDDNAYWDYVWRSERVVRDQQLSQKWNPTMRRVTTNFSWSGVGESFDMVNRFLQLSPFPIPRKIASWRQTHASVMEQGTWVYCIWSPLSAHVYVGQTGGHQELRSVFDRFRDHVLLARDWGLLAKYNSTCNIPLYQWISQMGIPNVCVTPLQRCTPASVCAVEKRWMRRFGTSHLLNRQLPSFGNERWRWLYKIKNAAKLIQSHQPQRVETLRERADKYLRGLRSNLTVEQKMILLLDSKTHLPHDIAGPTAVKIRAQIKRDTGYRLPPALVLKIPLLRQDHRSVIADLVLAKLRHSPTVPSVYVEYVRRVTRVVAYPLPTCVSFFRSFRVVGSTDSAIHDHLLHPIPCDCMTLHQKTGVPLVQGHVMTRSFDWMAALQPPLDPRVFKQCLKNAVLPTWAKVGDGAYESLKKTLDQVPGLLHRDKSTLIARIMSFVQTLYHCAKSQVSVVHHERYIRSQLDATPSNLIFGFFDKGSTVLWAACYNLFIPNLIANFFQSPHRFTELLRCDNPFNASLNTYTWLTGSLSRFFFPERKQHPTPPSAHLTTKMHNVLSEQPTLKARGITLSKGFKALLEQELKTANRRYHTFLRKHFGTGTVAPSKKRKCVVVHLTKGCKRRRGLQQDQPTAPAHTGHTTVLRVSRPAPRVFSVTYFTVFSVIASFLNPQSLWNLLCTSKMVLWHTGQRLLMSTTRLTPWRLVYARIHSVFDMLEPPVVSNVYGLLSSDACPRYTAPTPPKSAAKCISTPNAQLLFKFKSKERALPPVMKYRQVLAYAAHPFPRIGKLMGRALTVFWKLVVKHLKPREMIAMTDLLKFVRTCVDQAPRPRKNQSRVWIEFDLVEMFPNIERHLVIEALNRLHSEVRKKMGRRLPLCFFIAKGGNRGLDAWEKGSSADFHCFTFDDTIAYVVFDLTFNTICRILSSVVMQTTGTPIGGSLSAQIASLVLLYRELTARSGAKRSLDAALWSRYRDNFSVNTAVTMRRNETLTDAVQRRAGVLQKQFKSVFNMSVTLEQWGTTIDYLESNLADVHGPQPLHTKTIQWDSPPGVSTPPRISKLIDPTAPNARDMVTTLVPNEVKKSAWYRLSPAAATENLSSLVHLLTTKKYPNTWWANTLRKSAGKWGLQLPTGPHVGPLGEPVSRRGARFATSTRAARRPPHWGLS